VIRLSTILGHDRTDRRQVRLQKEIRALDTAYDFADRRVRLMGKGLSLIFQAQDRDRIEQASKQASKIDS